MSVLLTATEDYLRGAISGPASGYGLHLDGFEGWPAAKSWPADSTRQVVFSCSSSISPASPASFPERGPSAIKEEMSGGQACGEFH
jgi:hypothetical protein